MAEYKAPERIRIVWFSGTGCTKMAADMLTGSLEEKGVSVRQQELSVREQTDESFREDMLVVMYPVYAFSAPGPVFNYIKNHNNVENIPAAVISVSGGGEVTANKACRRRVIKLLEKKGYTVVYERMLVMPSNVFVKTPPAEAVRLIKILPAKIGKMTDDLMGGVTRRTQPGVINTVLSVFGEAEKLGARQLGRHIRVGPTCSGCGICAANCPSGNITLTGGRPVFGKKCVTCLRCFYHCPQKALTPRFGKFIVLKEGFSLDEVCKEAKDTTISGAPKFMGSAAWIGLRSYIEEKD